MFREGPKTSKKAYLIGGKCLIDAVTGKMADRQFKLPVTRLPRQVELDYRTESNLQGTFLRTFEPCHSVDVVAA